MRVQYLDSAVAAFRAALQVRTRRALPQEWAETQSNLGNTFVDLAERSEGAEAKQYLASAVTAYRGALHVRTREALPQRWARTQNSMGNALFDLGKSSNGVEATGYLDQAVSAYRAALQMYARPALPRDWPRCGPDHPEPRGGLVPRSCLHEAWQTQHGVHRSGEHELLEREALAPLWDPRPDRRFPRQRGDRAVVAGRAGTGDWRRCWRRFEAVEASIREAQGSLRPTLPEGWGRTRSATACVLRKGPLERDRRDRSRQASGWT